MKFWNSDEELDALIDKAAADVTKDDNSGVYEGLFPDSSNLTKWQERITQVKADYESELNAKKQYSQRTGDVEVFTPDDIGYMLQENESFKGKNLDLAKIKRYNSISASAQWLYTNHSEITGIHCPPVSECKRTACIGVDTRKAMFISGRAKDVLANMILLCDTLTISGMDKDVEHLSFMVRDIWEE